MSNDLILIRGLPGSGKSTMAINLLNRGAVDYHFEADMYFIDENGNYDYRANEIREAHKWCLEHAEYYLKQGKKVVVSNTFTQLWELQPYYDLGYATEVMEAIGNYGSMHNVPKEVISHMANRWEFIEYRNDVNNTLLGETVNVINDINKHPREIIYIGDLREACGWNEFQIMANEEYDGGYGTAEVRDIVIVFRDKSYLQRAEYDGSEWWEYIYEFPIPEDPGTLTNLFYERYKEDLCQAS